MGGNFDVLHGFQLDSQNLPHQKLIAFTGGTVKGNDHLSIFCQMFDELVSAAKFSPSKFYIIQFSLSTYSVIHKISRINIDINIRPQL